MQGFCINCWAQCSPPGIILGDSVACVGSAVDFSNDSLGGIWYISNPSVGTILTTGATTGTFIATAPDTVTIIYYTGPGCLASKTITVFPTPSIGVISSASTLCSGLVDTLVASSSATDFFWMPGTGLSSTTGSSVTAVSIATVTAIFTYSVIAIDTNGCANTATVTYTVNPRPTMTANAAAPAVCSGFSNTLTVSGSTAAYTWTPSTGLLTTTGNAVVSTRTVSVTSSFVYTVSGTDTNGCSNTATVTYTVNPQPTLTVTATPAVCSGVPNTLVASGAVSYMWSPSAGLSSTTGSSVTATQTVSVKTPFAYTVTGTDTHGCINTTVITYTVNPSPTVTTTVTATSICSGLSNTLAASGSVITYAWSPSIGLSATTGSSVTATVTVTVTSPFIYTVVGTDTNGCANTATVTYTVNPRPTITANAGAPAVCSGFSNTLTVSGSTASYTWTPSTGLSATTGNIVTATRTASTSSSITYTVTGTDANGCSNIATITYTVNPLPTLTVTATPAVCSGVPNTLVASGAVSYMWSPSAGLSSTTGSSVTATQTVSIITSFTHAVIGIDFHGCSSIATATYTVNPLPTVSVSAATLTVCSGTSNTLTTSGSASTYTWSPSTGLSATTGSSITATRTATATSSIAYLVIGTDNNGCTGIATVTYTVNPLPTVNVFAAIPAVCSGFSNTLTVSGGATAYTWTPSTGLSATTGNIVTATRTASTSSSITYSVTGTDANGCSNVATITYTVNPLPTLTVTATPAVCSGIPNTMMASGAASYIWSPSTGLSSTTGSSVTATRTPLTVSSFTYAVLSTDIHGCVNTATITYTVNPLPTVTVASAATRVCSGSPNVFTAFGSAATYSWSPSTGLSTTTGSSVNVIRVVSVLSSFSYMVVGTDTNGCASNAILTYTVSPLPTIAVSATSSAICSGYSNTLSASGSPATYSWSPSTGLSATTGISVAATRTVPAVSLVPYTVVGTDGNGCVNSATVTYTVNPLPTFSIIGATAVCSGFSNTLIASGTATTYVWSPPSGLSATNGISVIATHTVSVALPFTYAAVGIDANGCANSSTITYTVNPLPIITATSANSAICNGQPNRLTASGSATTYAWNPVIGLTAPAGDTVIATRLVSTASSFTYSVTGTDGNGCSKMAALTYTVNPLPVVNAASTASAVCSGVPNILTASGNAATYTWAPSNGLSATTGDHITATQTVSIGSSFPYIVTGTDTNGCISTAVVTYVVNQLPTFAIAASASVCSGTSNPLTVPPLGMSYTWSPSTGLSATTGSFITATQVVASSYTYTATGTDSHGCINTATTIYTVNPLPIVSTATAASSVCSGLPNTLFALGGAGAPTFTWSPSTGLSATTGLFVDVTKTVSTVSSFTYLVIGTDINGCTSSATVNYIVNPLPNVTASAARTTCSGLPNMLVATGAANYSWSPSSNLSATIGDSVTATHNVSTVSPFIYSVTGTDSHGCVNTATVTYTVNPQPVVTTTPAASTICSISTNTLTATGANNYVWTPSTGLSATTGSFVSATQTVGVASSFTYSVIGTDIKGCADTTSVTYIVNPLPVVTTSGTPAAVCSGFPDTLVAFGSAIIYAWLPLAGLSATTGSWVTATRTVSTQSVFTYSVTGTDTNGCVNTATVTYTVNPLPIVTVATRLPSVCSGFSDTLTASGSSNFYLWTPSSGLSATTGDSPIATQIVATASVFTYTVAGTDSNGCGNTAAVIFTVTPSPIISVAAISRVCSGLPDTLIATGGGIYMWSPSVGLSVTTGNTVIATQTVTVVTPLIYTVIGIDTFGCADTFLVAYTINPLPIIITNAAHAVCSGFPDTLIASGAVSYVWQPPTDLSAATGDSVIAMKTVLNQSFFTYSVTGIDTNGCVNRAIVNYKVSPLPVILPLTKKLCSGERLSISLTANMSSTFQWSALPNSLISGATSGTTGFIGDTLRILEDSLSTVQTYSVVATSDTLACKSNISEVNVYVSPIPRLNVTRDTICSGNLLNFQPSCPIKDSGGCLFEVRRPDSNITISIVQSGSAYTLLDKISTHSLVRDSIEYKYFFMSASSGCKDSSTLKIVINPTPSTPHINSHDSLTQFIAPCARSQLINIGTVSPPPTNVHNYWNTYDFNHGNALDSIIVSDSTQFCLVSYNYVGKHLVTAFASVDGFYCPSEIDSFWLNVTKEIATDPPLIYYGHHTFECLDNWVKLAPDTSKWSYLWGWEDKHSLRPFPQYQEINQIWNAPVIDTDNNNYWVITIDSTTGCPQKSYYGQGKWARLLPANDIRESVLSVYPNPTSGRLTVEISIDSIADFSIEIVSLTGQILQNIAVPAKKFDILMVNNSDGIYYLILFDKRRRQIDFNNFFLYK